MDVSRTHIEFVFLWLLCTIMLNSGMCSLKVHCNEKDMHTLLDFKQGVIDPSSLLSSWHIAEQDCCQWEGVHCDNITGRVTELSLPCHTISSAYGDKDNKSHCLTGEVNLSLLELEFLSHLDLSNNDFKVIQYNSQHSEGCYDMPRVTPPHQCGNSSNLHYLDLSYNFDIVIDNLNWISRLSSLQYLNFNGIDLHKENDWLYTMTMLPSLLELHLGSCQFENIYPSLQYANFTSLEVLDLAGNDFISELPSWLFNLSCDISSIDLSQNKIHGQLYNALPNLRNIKFLVLSDNNLEGPLPDWLGQLEHLQELHLFDNLFSGPIPPSLGNLSSLSVLDLGSNHLNGSLPESLGKLSNLEVLAIDDNSLAGIVSERNFLSLSNLKHLYLRSQALIFDFDPKWVPPFQLDGIWLGYLSPKLPSWLFTQISLKVLYIADSNASFEPLEKFWNFAELDYLYLYNNSIDADMSNVLLNSKVTKLCANNLRGGLPQLSPNMITLSLCDNFLSGSISPLLCHKMKVKRNLAYLDISNNLLSGGLTDCWMDWKSLVHVNLGNNNLTGKIPPSMSLLSNLVSLHLNDNKFYGDVPLSLKHCQNLWILNLGENKFSGVIPNWMVQGSKALQLRSNQFTGNFPLQLCQLNSLIVLDLANNRLSGPLPNCFSNMTAMVSDYASIDKLDIYIQLENLPKTYDFSLMLLIKGNKLQHSNLMYVLDFSSNNFSGTVPSEIFRLTRLQSLNLSHNQLVGVLSDEIGNLKQLEAIDLSSNRLSGKIPQSMSALSFLGFLNLSFNNFTGEIPSGTQLQGFTNLSYMGNSELCGPPLTKNCTKDENSHNTKSMAKADDEKSEIYSWFFMGMGIGFAIGFWIVFGAILFNRTCRHAYFRFLDRLYVMVIQKMNSNY